MVLGFVYSDPVCGEVDTRPWIVGKVHYMYFAMFSFFSTGIVMAIVSLCSKHPSEDQIRGLTFWTRKQMVARDNVVGGSLTNYDSNSFWGSEKRTVDEVSRGDNGDNANVTPSQMNAIDLPKKAQSNGEWWLSIFNRRA